MKLWKREIIKLEIVREDLDSTTCVAIYRAIIHFSASSMEKFEGLAMVDFRERGRERERPAYVEVRGESSKVSV